MKLAFSTLGCPGWSWNEIFASAKDIGMDGIEVRGLEDEMFAPAAKPFLPGNRAATVARMREAGMCFPMLTSGACLGTEGADGYMAEARAYIDLAGEIGAPDVRVMCTSTPQPVETDLAQAKRLYVELAEYAAERGVHADIETNGVLADTAALRKFMEGVPEEGSGVLWDVHHPFRYFGEAPETTAENIGRYVRYMHVKDSVMKDGKVSYRMMGYGDLPVFDALKAMSARGYDGFVSLEWVKRWCPDLQEPGIVFAHYASYMKYLLDQI